MKTFICPNCERTAEVADEMVGRRLECPRCKYVSRFVLKQPATDDAGMNTYFLKYKGEVHGPLTPRKLKAGYDAGKLTPQDEISKFREGPWSPVTVVKGITFDLQDFEEPEPKVPEESSAEQSSNPVQVPSKTGTSGSTRKFEWTKPIQNRKVLYTIWTIYAVVFFLIFRMATYPAEESPRNERNRSVNYSAEKNALRRNGISNPSDSAARAVRELSDMIESGH